MRRSILVGEGQLQLFRDLDRLAAYVEAPEAETGKYKAYTEDGARWTLSVISERVGGLFPGDTKRTIPVLDGSGDAIRQEFLLKVAEFSRRNEDLDLPDSFDAIFDALEDRFGYTA